MVAAIRAIASSEITPGPLGMAETSPKAEAPQAIACAASTGDLIQQIFTRGRDFMAQSKIQGAVGVGSGGLLGGKYLISKSSPELKCLTINPELCSAILAENDDGNKKPENDSTQNYKASRKLFG